MDYLPSIKMFTPRTFDRRTEVQTDLGRRPSEGQSRPDRPPGPSGRNRLATFHGRTRRSARGGTRFFTRAVARDVRRRFRRPLKLPGCQTGPERAPTALQGTSPGLPPRSLLAPHSRSHAFGTPRRSGRGTGYHPGRVRASRVSRRRCRLSLVAIGCDPESRAGTRSRQGSRSFRGTGRKAARPRFRGTERRSIPLPVPHGRSPFGIDSQTADPKAVARLSRLSYSPPGSPRTPGRLARYPTSLSGNSPVGPG